MASGFRISENITNGLLLAVVVGVVGGVVTNESRLSVVEERNRHVTEILEQMVAISEKLGVQGQAINSVLHSVNLFHVKVDKIEDIQSRNTERAAQHQIMYATKGSQVDDNRDLIRDLQIRFTDLLIDRGEGGTP